MQKVTKPYRLFSVMKYVFSASLCLCLSSVMLIVSHSGAYAASSRVDSIRSSILALDSARDTAVKELEEENLSAEESADYVDFVIYLNTRIFTYCRELEPLGEAALIAELPCPSLAMLGTSERDSGQEQSSQGTVDQGYQGLTLPLPASSAGQAATRSEQTGVLHDGFLEALGEFDELLAQEDEKVASRIPSQREPGNGQASASGNNGTAGGQGGQGGAGSPETSSAAGAEGLEGGEGDASEAFGAERAGLAGTGASPDSGGSQGQASADDHARYGAPGGKLPPPEDDDIVARQLREAADKEPDPELRAKLWEEYWKYKGVVRK